MKEAEPQNLDVIDVQNEQQETDLPERSSRRLHSVGRSLGTWTLVAAAAFGIATLVALDEADSHDSQANDRVKGKTEQIATTTTSTTIGPSMELIKPDYYGPACSSKEVEIKAGKTVFGITTRGLRTDSEYDANFANSVFAWNLNYIKEQAKKDPVLANPGSIPIGHKLKIETDCLYVDGVSPYRDYTDFDYSKPNSEPPISYYTRNITFQFYPGTDGKTHNNVDVGYVTDSKGKLQSVRNCSPEPECYDFVAGMP